ncbi:hypothetical protein CYLTODRAFT_259987 [Cylindrobasidium torrendii FP15055 ss-10]|uniref:Uncharacterized protein n=1 Tax=Cylindrobasidium torrendii FP15055 ss-10 TaxID=1314674 RepID=A0A0D7ARF7_9AGAR|nr:hypothetical protein CYLTODRAFT_259987 [Cylindrobasidium torrendii FP15055 ss-10]
MAHTQYLTYQVASQESMSNIRNSAGGVPAEADAVRTPYTGGQRTYKTFLLNASLSVHPSAASMFEDLDSHFQCRYASRVWQVSHAVAVCLPHGDGAHWTVKFYQAGENRCRATGHYYTDGRRRYVTWAKRPNKQLRTHILNPWGPLGDYGWWLGDV